MMPLTNIRFSCRRIALPTRNWPIILFLHRAGERGSDGLIRTQVGIGTAVRKERTRFAAINVMPQCKTNSWWSEPAMEELALATLTAASKEFKGDPKRTYLAGLSTGWLR
jgi:predicted peptidase